MGYRFTLETANIIANLTSGKIQSCYEGIYSSPENYYGFIYFLENFSMNMYSDNNKQYLEDIYRIRKLMEKRGYYEEKNRLINERLIMLDELKSVSRIFDRCPIKSLLLPRAIKDNNYSYTNDFMTSEIIMEKLLRIHPGSSCLILQPQEPIFRNSVTVLDAFPNFDVALKQIDLWPAVMFWDKNNNFAFVPVEDEDELLYLYKIIYYERDSIDYLRRYANKKRESSYYYFHLSDLHIGTRNVDVSKRRLKSLISKQISELEPDDSIDFIITGDAVDSPTKVNNYGYVDFSEFLESKSGKKPIFVLGNHDVNIKGLAFKHRNQRLANYVGNYPDIQINDEIKVIFLLFNSNTNGNFAEGEIGLQQLSEMGNILDSVTNLQEYKLVAILHHHVTSIKTPDFYNEKWYEKILPKGFIEQTLRLKDAEPFLKWLKIRNVSLVLHGHKHIPYICEHNGINIIACGSSTGQVSHKEAGKTYLSYNVLKFNKDNVVCTQFAEELLGAGAKDIRTVIIEY